MKPLKNAEEKLREQLEGDGWVVVHKGWPDFACIRNGEMIFIEVKGYKGEMLSKEQHYILTNLAKLGLDCFKWESADGFERITASTPMPITTRKSLKGKKKGLSVEEILERNKEKYEEDKDRGFLWRY